MGGTSALDPRGPQAALAAELWWLMFWLAAGVYALVLALFLIALFRRRSAAETRADGLSTHPHVGGPASRFAGNALVVAGGIVLPVAILGPLSVVTVGTLAAMSSPAEQPGMVVQVIGYQYWWEVRYPNEGIITANEVHIPTGRTVELRLDSVDVIHSLWLPQLMTKLDMLPGKQNVTWLRADEPGLYRGECAELCGVQHAKMALLVVAEPPEQFAAWLEAQRQPAVEPADPLLRRGAQVFAREGCITCHAIQYGSGTVGGQLGPNLTHLAGRLTLAAGTLPNNRGNLAGWIANPQALKPGNKMPITQMDGESLLALVAYLESLK